MFWYVLQLLCDLSTQNQISKQLQTSQRSCFSVGQQVTTGDRGWTSRQSDWIYLRTSARLDATDQFPCQEPVDNKLADNWSLCIKIVNCNRPMDMKLAAIYVHGIIAENIQCENNDNL